MKRLMTVAELPVLEVPAAEIERARALTARHGMTREHAVDLSDPVITRVERTAAERPDLPAVTDAARTLSYAQLAAEARRLATLLEREGVRPGDVVGVGGARCAAVISAFLAIELVGALYVPADETWPAARVRDVLDQAGANVLLTVDTGEPASALIAGAAEAGVRVVRTPPTPGRTTEAQDPDHNPGVALDCEPWEGQPRLESLDQPRYVLFTSGSTGKPKGAVVEHQGMINHLYAKIVDLELTGADVLAQTAPLGFDISVWQMLCPLLIGGRVDVIGDDVGHDPVAFARAVDDQGITIVELVPTMVRHLLDDLAAAQAGSLSGLRWMIATGEELPAELSRRWLETMPHARLLNAYGPTECSDDVTHHTIVRSDLELLRLPIGTPIINTQLYVLKQEDDDTWTACDLDETGELFVGGVCVGRGYLGNPERTSEAFYKDPFGATPTQRLYRTGDAVKLLSPAASGSARPTLQYLGRVDRQVKISGVRMELGEIEAVLQRHPGVGAAAVVVHEYP
ncbi:amino acid adenylation domain-containing protein [Actinomadura barringtoniae]|uniref:Amino acid adenylation domain-containing protein n=1 Tax=Actinomadura barringtoniae TaxID=1427535 RepID=A0A939TCJ4_9ACTN|nr:amino acid adenylation domain-containing protein [Actinomadura barringtoniae]MBO2451315.1 amino acid adenylation domain-containing protein [Actinomadura barringtoniae]